MTKNVNVASTGKLALEHSIEYSINCPHDGFLEWQSLDSNPNWYLMSAIFHEAILKISL